MTARRSTTDLELGVDLRAVMGTDFGGGGVSFDGDYVQAAFFVGWRL